MRGHALLGGLAALALAAVWASPRSERTREVFRAGGRSGVGVPLFQFLPASGAGAPAAMDLCDAVTTDDKAGNWWCIDGAKNVDYGPVDPGFSFTSVDTSSRALCSNGLNCTAVDMAYISAATDDYSTATGKSITGTDVTIAALTTSDDLSLGGALVGIHRTSGNGSLTLYVSANQPVCQAVSTSGATTTINSAAMVARTWQLVVCTYHDTGAVGELKLYVDGALITQNMSAVRPLPTSVRFEDGSIVQGGNWLGLRRGVLFTETVLDSTAITRLTNSVHGTLTGSRGEAVTFTRTSAQTCDNGSGAVTVLPSGRPCVAQGGYLSEGSATNLELRSEELTAAPWAGFQDGPEALPTVTANQATAPDGTLTAERIEIPATTTGSSFHGSNNNSLTSGTTYTASVWVKGNGTSGSVRFGWWNTNSGAQCSVTSCAYTASAWTRCTHSAAAGATDTFGIILGNPARTGCAAVNPSPAHDVFVWGAQLETGAFASSYIRTEGSTATRNASTATVASVTGLSDTAGCFAGTLLTSNTTNGARLVGIGNLSGTPGYVNNSTSVAFYDGTTGIAASCPGGSIVGRSVRVRSWWSGTSATAECEGTAGTPGVYDGAFIGTGAVYLGHNNGSNMLNGFLGRVALSDSTWECRP